MLCKEESWILYLTYLVISRLTPSYFHLNFFSLSFLRELLDFKVCCTSETSHNTLFSGTGRHSMQKDTQEVDLRDFGRISPHNELSILMMYIIHQCGSFMWATPSLEGSAPSPHQHVSNSI